MDIFKDRFLSLFDAFVAFLIGLAWARLIKWWRLRGVRNFWKPIIQDGPIVVVGRFTEFSGFEASGFIGMGDAAALSELLRHLESLGIKAPRWEYADRLNGDALKNHLILVGGPDANAVTRETVSRVETSIRFGDPTRHEISIHDTVAGQFYSPNHDSRTGEVTLDYGLMVSAPNPFQPAKRVLIIAGSFGFGTWAGCRLAIRQGRAGNSLYPLSSDFECLFQTDVVYSTPQDIKVISCRTLSPKGHSKAGVSSC